MPLAAHSAVDDILPSAVEGLLPTGADGTQAAHSAAEDLLPPPGAAAGEDSHSCLSLGLAALSLLLLLLAVSGSAAVRAGADASLRATTSAAELEGWEAVQAYADCVSTRGRWLDRAPESQVIVGTLHNPAYACQAPPWPPWLPGTDPAFFYAYAGHPPQCPLPAWSRAAFCRALGGRPLLLVGDSTTFTSHDSLLGALMDAPFPPGSTPLGHSQFDPCPGHAICGVEAEATADLPQHHPDKVLPTSLTFIRSDDLALTVAEDPKEIHVNWHRPWLPLVRNSSVLLMNRGAHFVDTGLVVEELETVLTHVLETFPGALIVFRNTVGGVENLTGTRTRRPTTSPPVYAPGGLGEQFNWADFPAQNVAVRELIDSLRDPHSGGGLLYLDVAHSTMLRPDHHFDWLHACIPGPQDHWAQLLQAVLEEARRVSMKK